MAQATTPALPAPPAGYGSAFRQTFHAAIELTNEHLAALNEAFVITDPSTYDSAAARLDEALDLLGVDDVTISGHEIADDAVYAVLARDRGLITTADFNTLTTPWVAAGLPLPAVVTGDDPDCGVPAPMTSDRIADELLTAADGDTHYGAVLALTGYNHCELLAYDAVREFVVCQDDGSLAVDWDNLTVQLGKPHMFADLPYGARDFLIFAASLSRHGIDVRPIVIVPVTSDNAELVTLSVAYTLGTNHMIDPCWQAREEDVSPGPAAVPNPRAGQDSGTP